MKILEIFQESDHSYSWGRVASSVTTGFSIWALVHQTIGTGHIPDAATLSGLMAFALGPYATNKAATAFGKAENL